MKEFVEFLGQQSPYDRLNDADLTRLASHVEVEFFPAGAIIVPTDSPPLTDIYVVRTGSVEILDRGRVADILSVGDTFGHISVLSGLPPSMVVRAHDDCLCYRFPDPRVIIDRPDLLRYGHYGQLIARERLVASGGPLARLETPLSKSMQPILWCGADDVVRDVARRMTESGRSCAIFQLTDQYGIVTEHDFSRRIATGEIGIDEPVRTVGSTPALSVSSTTTGHNAYLFMIRHGIHHLVVDDPLGRPAGVVRVVDFTAAEVRDPLVIRRAIGLARTPDELATACASISPTAVELWRAGVSAEHFGAVLTAMIQSALLRIIEMSTAEGILETLTCSWLLLGSAGRGEPLLNSDLDTALIWEPRDPETSVDPDEVVARVTPIIGSLPHYGFLPCPQNLNASSPLFCRSVDQWEQAAGYWRTNPTLSNNLLTASTLLDGHAITEARLASRVYSQVLASPGRDQFARVLTRSAVATRPPTGFVRGLVVGHLGEHRGDLNLKKCALRPIAGLARALALRAGDTSGSTPERLARAKQAGLLHAEEADALIEAFWLAYQLAIDHQVTAITEGTTPRSSFPASSLNPLLRRHLRETFRVIGQVQDRFGDYYEARL